MHHAVSDPIGEISQRHHIRDGLNIVGQHRIIEEYSTEKHHNEAGQVSNTNVAVNGFTEGGNHETYRCKRQGADSKHNQKKAERITRAILFRRPSLSHRCIL